MAVGIVPEPLDEGTFSTQPSSETSAGTASSSNTSWSVDQQSGSSFAQGYGGSSAWSIDQASGKVNVNFFGDINLQGNSILDVNKITGYLGKWSLDENGKLTVKEIETEKIKSQKGYTVPDEDTGALFCIKVKSGALVAAQGECGQETSSGTATSTP